MLRKFTPSPAMVVAVAALVMAGAGTGYAAVKLPAKSVGAPQLRNSSVTTPKLKNGAVSAAKLKDNSVAARHLQAQSVGAAQVVPESLTGGQINEATLGTVPSANTANAAGVAGRAPISGLGYQQTHIGLPAGMGMTAHIDCPAGPRPLSGGARMDDPINEYLVDEYPQANGWTVNVANTGPDDSGFTAYVTCADAAQGTPAAPKAQGKATAKRFRVVR